MVGIVVVVEVIDKNLHKLCDNVGLSRARRTLHQRHRAREHRADGLGLRQIKGRAPQEFLQGKGIQIVCIHTAERVYLGIVES